MNWRLFIPFGVALLGGILFSLTRIYDGVVVLMVLGVFFVAIVLAAWWAAMKMRIRSRILKEVFALLPLAVYFAIIVSDLPLRLAFALNRAEFDRVIVTVESDEAPKTPFWIGPFRIAMVGKRDYSGAVYLAVNSNKWEINGFVPNLEGRGFNL